MSDPLESRLRDELRALGEQPIDGERLLSAARRRARRRAVRHRATATAGVVGIVAGVAVAWPAGDAPDAVTDPSGPGPATPPSTAEGSVPADPGTTTFDPIPGMDAAWGDEPLPQADMRVVHEAEQRLIAACMSERGFDYELASLADGPGSPPQYLSPAELRAEGYRYDWAAAAREFLEDSPDPTAGLTEDEVEAYATALFGTEDEMVWIEHGDGSAGASADGCLGEARSELFGSIRNYLWFDVASEGLSGIRDALRTDDAYRAPLADWQACMMEAGHDVGDHDYGADHIRQQGAVALDEQGPDQTVMTAETIEAIAEADADCQESSGLHEVRQELLPQAREALAAEIGVGWHEWVAFQHALRERAEQLG
ncbi:MAG TPA: hypothetical protein VFZ77_19190 [Acidimicrobiales bacterium]